jgi:hypothetical protein
MDSFIFIMPVVAMVVGLGALFLDPKTTKFGFWVALTGLFLIAGLTIAFNLKQSQDKEKALQESTEREKKTTAILLNLTEQTRPIPDLVAMLRGFGFSSQKAETATTASVSRSIVANRAYQGLLSARTGGHSETHVEYFPKDVDGEKVIAAMKEAGLNVVEKRPVREEATNAVWVGDDVPVDDAKLVGLALLRAGVDVVAIRRFRDGGGIKSKLIQVGSDAAMVGSKPLTAADVSVLALLPRDPRSR